MKLIRKTALIRRQNDSIVHCEIELCADGSAPGRYLVNLRQGRMGEEWRESTRTPQPVDLASAETLFHLALTERMAQGFVAASEAAGEPAPPPAAPAVPAAPAAIPGARILTEGDRILLQRLERGSWAKLSANARKRTVWRIGERRLQAAVPVLVGLIERGDALQDYCIAWAIGRCGDAGAAEAMRTLHLRSANDAVRRVALYAWLALAGEDERLDHARELYSSWPAPLQAAWQNGNVDAILGHATSNSTPGKFAFDAWLEQLDQMALADAFRPLARAVLLATLATVALLPGTFRAVRHIYKMAEMRADGDVFGILQRRFETAPHSSGNGVYTNRRWMSHREAAALPDAKAAYSDRTRNYLLRRGWRTLRRLGSDGDADFVAMAVGILAGYDDRDAGKTYRSGGRAFDRYSYWPMFNFLLRQHAGLRHSRSGRSWYRDDDDDAPQAARPEAFPALWDRHPDALLQLLRRSRCEGVHEFAGRALADNLDYCATLPLDILRDLLQSAYTGSARFAFTVARRRFEPGVPDTEWLMLFVRATLPEAVQYALDCIGRDPARYAADPALVVAILTAPAETVRRQGWILCQAAMKLPGRPEAIILALLDWFDARTESDAGTPIAAIGADVAWALDHPLRPAAEVAPQERLVALLLHPLAAVRTLACNWLLLHAAPVSSLPAPILASVLRDPDPGVRALGVRLFASLPDAILASQVDLVGVFTCAPESAIRKAVGPVIERLAASTPGFAAALLPVLLDGLFRSETGDGMHADLLAWIAGPLAQQPELADPDLLRRLLAARSKGAQLLGASLVERFDAGQFDVTDWAAFGRNQNLNVRRWAYAAFTACPERARADLEAALRLFDSRFDDTREFAIRYFGSVCTKDDWTPLLLVNLCDHPEPAAQRFGRSMITTHFDVADVTEFLFKLSQHPSPSMQLFVSAWLESACTGDIEKLRRLEPYFLTVLSHVHRGRVVKNRVLAFLGAQALLSEDIGAFVARLFARQVVTVAIGDKARYIEALHAIQQRYPAMPAVMTIQAPTSLTTARSIP